MITATTVKTRPPRIRQANGLTARQEQILRAVWDFFLVSGRTPTLRELGDNVGIASVSAVHAALLALVKKGWLSQGHAGHFMVNGAKAVAAVEDNDAGRRLMSFLEGR